MKGKAHLSTLNSNVSNAYLLDILKSGCIDYNYVISRCCYQILCISDIRMRLGMTFRFIFVPMTPSMLL